jgi:hypothetical protein
MVAPARRIWEGADDALDVLVRIEAAPTGDALPSNPVSIELMAATGAEREHPETADEADVAVL